MLKGTLKGLVIILCSGEVMEKSQVIQQIVWLFEMLLCGRIDVLTTLYVGSVFTLS